MFVATDSTAYGLYVAALSASEAKRPAINPRTLVTETPLPQGITDVARLGTSLLTVSGSGALTAVDPATGRERHRRTVEPRMFNEARFADLSLVEADTAPDGSLVYVAGQFARRVGEPFIGFVLTVDSNLQVTHAQTFGHVIQDLAADARGAVVVLSEGTVADATNGTTLRAPTYERASDAYSVRRDSDGGLWIGVDEDSEDRSYLLTPTGRVDLPLSGAPYVLVAVPGGVAVLTQGLPDVFIINGRTRAVRPVAVPPSAAGGVVVGHTLYVVSAGSDSLTAVTLPGLAATTYTLPAGASIIG